MDISQIRRLKTKLLLLMEMHEEMGGGKEEKMNGKVKEYPPYLDYPKERKPKTNADRIRAMTDEELARFMSKVETNGRVFGLKGIASWLKWLKQEVDG